MPLFKSILDGLLHGTQCPVQKYGQLLTGPTWGSSSGSACGEGGVRARARARLQSIHSHPWPLIPSVPSIHPPTHPSMRSIPCIPSIHSSSHPSIPAHSHPFISSCPCQFPSIPIHPHSNPSIPIHPHSSPAQAGCGARSTSGSTGAHDGPVPFHSLWVAEGPACLHLRVPSGPWVEDGRSVQLWKQVKRCQKSP